MNLVKETVAIVKDHWIVTSLMLFTVLVYWHYVVNFTALQQLGIPGPKPLPFVGNFLLVLRKWKSLHTLFEEGHAKYGKVFGFYLLKQPSIVVGDPEILKQIMVKEFEKFPGRPNRGFDFPEPLKSMLTSVEGPAWKNLRSILTPAFTSGKLKNMMYIMHEAGDTIVQKMGKAADENQVIDIHNWQQSVTMEVILSAAYGLQSDCQTNPNEKVTSYVKRAMTPKPWPSIALWIPFIGKKVSKSLLMSKWGLHWGPVVDIAKKILRERRSDGEKREDMLQNMLDAQHPEKKGHKLTEDELIGEMVLFMLAGYDTSSNVLGLTCYHLAVYPEIQEKVYQEIKNVCQSMDTVTYDEIKDMPYLEACISETMRLCPPGFITGRTVKESCVINGVRFKKDMAVLIPVYALHRDEEFWSEPNTFKPERFLPENKDSITEFAYLPFGSGPRHCIGMRFAQMEMKTILVRMLQKFRMERCSETPVSVILESRTVMSPGEPLWIQFKKRQGPSE